MRLIIDRFEGAYAVCEDENKIMVNILKTRLPGEVKEGSVLDINGELIKVDHNETKNREKRLKEKMDGMWDK